VVCDGIGRLSLGPRWRAIPGLPTQRQFRTSAWLLCPRRPRSTCLGSPARRRQHWPCLAQSARRRSPCRMAAKMGQARASTTRCSIRGRSLAVRVLPQKSACDLHFHPPAPIHGRGPLEVPLVNSTDLQRVAVKHGRREGQSRRPAALHHRGAMRQDSTLTRSSSAAIWSSSS
jgi:hypothetical protein